MKPLITLCMIVRNEALVLERCLASVSGWIDELIVVDTGSTDNTKRIAEARNASIYEFAWTDDFAEARNFSLSKAAGQWILVLDADEYVEPASVPALLDFLRQADSSNPIGIVLPIYNYVDREGSGKISQSSAVRLFPCHPSLGFEGAIHEQLRSRDGELRLVEFDFPIYHTGYTTETIAYKDKSARNEAIFSRLRSEGRWTRYDAFTLGNEYFAQDRYEEALRNYEEADRPSEARQPWLLLCIGNRVSCLLKLQRYTDAWKQIKRGQTLWPKHCDFYWLEGYALALLGWDEEALSALALCMDKSKAYLISPNFGTTLPLQQAAALHLRRFELTQAVSCLTKLCYASPDQLSVLLQLLKLFISASEPVDRIDSFLRSLYPKPQPYQRVMILDVLLTLGLKELTEKYWHTSVQAKDPLTPSIRLRYALLTNQLELGAAILQSASHEQDRAWAISMLRASFQWKEQIGDQYPMPAEQSDELVAAVCLQYFREGQFDLYDSLINAYPDLFESLANRLGDALFEDRQFELALDYYSLLLQRDALSPSGYENVGRLYLAQDELEEGLAFIEQASNAMPERVDLRILRLRHTQDPERRGIIINKLAGDFPGLVDFPALTL
ncbi:glycosyltransferase family 2 protein [Cohnella sp. GbtcB17]|uniref:glycosyltransferase family 2 protein n=1 Tax=Cohnella sp. GbtcB17 TaxID=2824762 RepID=UPI001C306100|nr:glycosyltransferase family 2 protein [Cohnella sp. GbtcB17]